MTITALPTPPTRGDPTNFASRADAFLAALPTFQGEANALAAAMNLNATSDTSTTSNAIGIGAKTFTVTAGKSFFGGMYLVIADTAAPSTNSMIAQVTSYSSTSLVVNVIYVKGSGTKTAWTISQSVPYASTIDDIPIGSTTPSTGAFTTLSATGDLVLAGADGRIYGGTAGGRQVTGNSGFTSYTTHWGASSGSPDKIDVVAGSTAVGRWSSTGLAVTGALSATVASSFASQLINSATGAASQAFGSSTGPKLLLESSTAGGANFYVGSGTWGSPTYSQAMSLDASSNLNLLVGNLNLFAVGAGNISATGPYNATTASAANMNIAADFFFRRSTSALKYKQDIRDLEAWDISQFRAVRYKSKCESDDQTIDHIGFIADEVDAAGHKELVNYGAAGEVEGFQYERMTVVLLKAMQEQQALIDSLTARLTALEAA